MNKQRRKDIDAIVEQFEEIKNAIQCVYDEEEEYRDNIPENMQSSERYETADAACSALDDALNNIDEAIDNLTSARDGGF